MLWLYPSKSLNRDQKVILKSFKNKFKVQKLRTVLYKPKINFFLQRTRRSIIYKQSLIFMRKIIKICKKLQKSKRNSRVIFYLRQLHRRCLDTNQKKLLKLSMNQKKTSCQQMRYAKSQKNLEKAPNSVIHFPLQSPSRTSSTALLLPYQAP